MSETQGSVPNCGCLERLEHIEATLNELFHGLHEDVMDQGYRAFRKWRRLDERPEHPAR